MKLREPSRSHLTTGVPPPQGSLLPCTREAFAEFDALLVATAHDQFKDPRLWGGVKLVVDTRNMVEPLFGEGVAGGPKRLVKAQDEPQPRQRERPDPPGSGWWPSGRDGRSG